MDLANVHPFEVIGTLLNFTGIIVWWFLVQWTKNFVTIATANKAHPFVVLAGELAVLLVFLLCMSQVMGTLLFGSALLTPPAIRPALQAQQALSGFAFILFDLGVLATGVYILRRLRPRLEKSLDLPVTQRS